MRRALAALAVSAAVVATRPAQAAPIDDEAYARLVEGKVVKEKIDLELPGGDYFGGVAYAAIQAPADDVIRALLEPANYLRILPLTLAADVVDRKGDLVYVRLTQGGRAGSATYTIVIQRASKHRVRFWLDPDRPHDIADCWGFFQVDPVGPTLSLVRYGALVHLDFGVTRLMFSEKIRDYALMTPGRLRRFVEGPK